MEWLLAHVDDDVAPAAPTLTLPTLPVVSAPKTDESLAEGSSTAAEGEAAPEAKSIKCEDCGRLFKTSLEVEFHATKSGHTNFSESTEEKKPLTEEEKKAQMQLIEEKIAKKRVEREELEKKDSLEKERMRIKSGKDMSEVRRKMEEEEMKKIVS
jgi:UBX domain-containing protein 1/4